MEACKRPFDTLFLDRDGVINRHRPHDYVKSTDELELLPGVLDALRIVAPLFKYIIVVTNQRGVGKGLMTEETLCQIHASLLEAIAATGGRVDRIYYCTDIAEDSPCRKPNLGMAYAARREFADIRFDRSIMVGDSVSDLRFARHTGMHAVWIVSPTGPQEISPALFDEKYPDLLTFAQEYQKDVCV